MCGIAGIRRFRGEPVDQDRLVRMGSALAHRGPDGDGVWIRGSVGFVHRRLSIVDLTEAGAQPMSSADGMLTVTFNGEIYNYQSLRKELEEGGVVFRSHTDTEVLLHLYERDGMDALHRLRGMFAFALWDAEKGRLFFARDRVGKKPFFYRQTDEAFSFASEIRSLVMNDAVELDWSAIRLFLGLQYVPSPRTGFIGILSLPPGYAGVLEGEKVRVWAYEQEDQVQPFNGSFSEAARGVRERFEEAVRLRTIADVPVGAFLSGGIDSSAVAIMMARASSDPIQVFTMGFPEYGFDERAEASELAKMLGATHHTFLAEPGDVASLIDPLVDAYGSPYADASCLPTWLLARETRKTVKAVMTGDGADELFCGYRRYRFFQYALALSRMGLSRPAASWSVAIARRKGDVRWERFAETVRGLSDSDANGYAALFTGAYFSDVQTQSLLQPEFAALTDADASERWIVKQIGQARGLASALGFDRHSYLPDDLLVKMDRATMAHGLEARSPFLDQEVVRFAESLPLRFKMGYGTPKRVLRAALEDVLPPFVTRRPKRGFQVPLAQWFRGGLRPLFVERCLSSRAALHRICKPSAVEELLRQHERGADHGNRLWMLLMLGSWLERYGK